jgi:magnesium transporter
MQNGDRFDRVRRLVEGRRLPEAAAQLELLEPAQAAALVNGLEMEEQAGLMLQLPAPAAADILQEMHSMDAARLAGSFDLDTLARITDEMEPDEAADLLNDLEREPALEVLSRMQRAEYVTPLLHYQDDTAGGRMTSEYLTSLPGTPVSEVVEALRVWQPREAMIPYVFVVDDQHRLLGVVGPLDLIRADPLLPVSEVMDPEVITVRVDEDQENAARLMAENSLAALPVVAEDQELVGIITYGDAFRTLEEEASEDILEKSGIGGLGGAEIDRSYVMLKGRIWQVWRIRVPFLLITMVGGLLAGVVIDVYEQALKTITALAIFIPIVMDMGGNAGTQSATIFARGFIAGHIQPHQFMRQFWRETLIGLGMGAGLGALVGLVAGTWQGMASLGWVVGIALGVTVTLSTMLGFVIPYVLLRLGMDQAAGADPILTTIKDITGLLIYFGLATLIMGPLL